MRPVAVAPVRTRHVLGHRGRSIRAQVAQMRGHQLAAVEDLHRLGRDARLHFLAQQPERHRIEMLVDLDVVVEVHPAALPVGVFVGCRRQGLQRRTVELFEQRAPRGAPAAHRPVVQLIHQFADRPVQLGQREEPPVAQPRQDPALHHLHADLDLCLVTRFVWTGRDDCGAVVRRHVGVGAVDRRLVEAGLGDPGPQVVADDLPRHAAEGGQRVDVRARSSPAASGSRWLRHRCSSMRPARRRRSRPGWISPVAPSITSMV